MIAPCGGDGYALMPEQGASARKTRYTFHCNCGYDSDWLYKTAEDARVAVFDHMSLEEPAEEEDNASSEEGTSSSTEDPPSA